MLHACCTLDATTPHSGACAAAHPHLLPLPLGPSLLLLAAGCCGRVPLVRVLLLVLVALVALVLPRRLAELLAACGPGCCGSCTAPHATPAAAATCCPCAPCAPAATPRSCAVGSAGAGVAAAAAAGCARACSSSGGGSNEALRERPREASSRTAAQLLSSCCASLCKLPSLDLLQPRTARGARLPRRVCTRRTRTCVAAVHLLLQRPWQLRAPVWPLWRCTVPCTSGHAAGLLQRLRSSVRASGVCARAASTPAGRGWRDDRSCRVGGAVVMLSRGWAWLNASDVCLSVRLRCGSHTTCAARSTFSLAGVSLVVCCGNPDTPVTASGRPLHDEVVGVLIWPGSTPIHHPPTPPPRCRRDRSGTRCRCALGLGGVRTRAGPCRVSSTLVRCEPRAQGRGAAGSSWARGATTPFGSSGSTGAHDTPTRASTRWRTGGPPAASCMR
jgi:hypothetical protein